MSQQIVLPNSSTFPSQQPVAIPSTPGGSLTFPPGVGVEDGTNVVVDQTNSQSPQTSVTGIVPTLQ
jgi:hypothetical protein